MREKVPIRERILKALSDAGGSEEHYVLANVVFPAKDFPYARKHASAGGPPGCYRALGSALGVLKREGLILDHRTWEDGTRRIWLISGADRVDAEVDKASA